MQIELKATEKLANWINGDLTREGYLLLDDDYIDEFISDEEILEKMEKSFNEKTESVSGWHSSNGILTTDGRSPDIADLHDIYGDDFQELKNNLCSFYEDK